MCHGPDRVYELLTQGSRKLRIQAADTRAAMLRNCEILIEGQIPVALIQSVR